MWQAVQLLLMHFCSTKPWFWVTIRDTWQTNKQTDRQTLLTYMYRYSPKNKWSLISVITDVSDTSLACRFWALRLLQPPKRSNLTSDLKFVAQITYATMFLWAVSAFFRKKNRRWKNLPLLDLSASPQVKMAIYKISPDPQETFMRGGRRMHLAPSLA